MQEYVTGEAESWSLFDQLIKPIPRLVYPFLFSLRESDHLRESLVYPLLFSLLIGKNFSQNFFINLFQFPSTSKDANEYHVFAPPASE
jgi:hypothetical protein